jgi:hypothetical protein
MGWKFNAEKGEFEATRFISMEEMRNEIGTKLHGLPGKKKSLMKAPRWTHGNPDGSREACGVAHRTEFAKCPGADLGWSITPLNEAALSPAHIEAFHGTESFSVTKGGLVSMKERHRHDPGDLGRGFYGTTIKERAASYGPKIIKARFDVRRYAVLSNPYFLDKLSKVEPKTEAEKLFYSLAFDDEGNMRTASGPPLGERSDWCERVRDGMLTAGFLGVRTDYAGEIVAYDSQTVTILEGP